MKLISVGTYNGGLQGWTLNSGNKLQVKFSFAAHDSSIRSLSEGHMEGEPLLASGGSDEMIK